MVDGIEIDKDVAEETLLPDDLNSLAVGSYVVPDPRKRSQYPFFVFAVLVITYLTSLVIDFVTFTPTFIILLFVVILLFLIDNKFRIQQQEVIEKITDSIEHSIGYYSIALTFDFSFKLKYLKPIWTVIVYDHNNPPQKKSIVEFDSITKDIISDVYTEDIVDA